MLQAYCSTIQYVLGHVSYEIYNKQLAIYSIYHTMCNIECTSWPFPMYTSKPTDRYAYMMYVHMYVGKYLSTNARMYVCIYACMYVCMYVCACFNGPGAAKIRTATAHTVHAWCSRDNLGVGDRRNRIFLAMTKHRRSTAPFLSSS